MDGLIWVRFFFFRFFTKCPCDEIRSTDDGTSETAHEEKRGIVLLKCSNNTYSVEYFPLKVEDLKNSTGTFSGPSNSHFIVGVWYT